MPFINKSPLNYPANSFDPIRIFEDNRAPTIADFKTFKVGDEWWDTDSNDFWKLVYRDSTQGIWRKMAGTASAIEHFLPDAGTSPVVPTAANEVTLTGGTGITTTGGLNSITWDLNTDVLMQVTAEDASTCAPAANNLNIVGTATNGINTTAAGSTLTVSMASPYADGDFIFENNVAATPRTLSIENNDVNVASEASLKISAEPLGGDSFVFWEIDAATRDFSMGIDNSDSDFLKLTNATTPSGGNDIFMVDPGTDTFTFYYANLLQTQALTGGGVNHIVTNTDATNIASDAFFSIETDPAGGDPFIHFLVGAITQEYSFGIDNSVAGDPLKLTDGNTPSLGTEWMTLDVPASTWSFPANVFNQIIANVGGAVTRTVSNTDNSNAASDANFSTVTGGASGGDPFIHFEIDSVQEYSFGIDNSSSDVLKITDGGSPSAGNILWQMTTAGERTMPLQPAFLATHTIAQNNVTGNGAVATVNFTTVIFDQNADYDATNTFTAPVTGRYRFESALLITDITAAMNGSVMNVVTSNRSYFGVSLNSGNARTDTNAMVLNVSCLADMDAADTVHITIKINTGAGNTADLPAVGGAGEVSYFSGSLEY